MNRQHFKYDQNNHGHLHAPTIQTLLVHIPEVYIANHLLASVRQTKNTMPNHTLHPRTQHKPRQKIECIRLVQGIIIEIETKNNGRALHVHVAMLAVILLLLKYMY